MRNSANPFQPKIKEPGVTLTSSLDKASEPLNTNKCILVAKLCNADAQAVPESFLTIYERLKEILIERTGVHMYATTPLSTGRELNVKI